MIPRRRRNRQAPRALQIGAAAVITATVLFGRQELAAAAFTMTARGSGVAQSSIMPSGKPPTPTVLQASVRLDWAPSTFASGQEVGGYIVRRQVLGSTDTVQMAIDGVRDVGLMRRRPLEKGRPPSRANA